MEAGDSQPSFGLSSALVTLSNQVRELQSTMFFRVERGMMLVGVLSFFFSYGQVRPTFTVDQPDLLWSSQRRTVNAVPPCGSVEPGSRLFLFRMRVWSSIRSLICKRGPSIELMPVQRTHCNVGAGQLRRGQPGFRQSSYVRVVAHDLKRICPSTKPRPVLSNCTSEL